MKAIIHTKYGGPEVLELKEVEKPIPGENEIIVKVYAATVNRTDCAMLRAKPFIMRFITGFFKPSKPSLGTDFAGEIVEVGKHVTSYKPGDKVFGFDDNGICSHAQYLTISEKNALTTIPDTISYAQAAASIEGAHYAYNFITKIKIKAHDKVLVNGASGAIGSAAVQLLKYYGAEVTAVCNTNNVDAIKSLGADKVIDYEKEDFTKSTEKFNYVFDAVGKCSFFKCMPLLVVGGVYISSELGWMAQNLFLSLFTPLFGRKKVKFPVPLNKKRSVLFISKLLSEGKFNPLIDRSYSLEEVPEAFIYVEKGQKSGNVIISIAHDH